MNNKWTIGEVAKLFGISTDTLRYYEKAGILYPAKDTTNGYRYYSYDEIVVLMDILFFRNMDVSVKDIKQIVTDMDIGDVKKILNQNQRILEDKIQELIKQSKMLAQVASQYELCTKRLGRFSIVPAPDFKYKFIGRHDEDFFDIMRRYKKMDHGWMNSTRYCLLLSQDELLAHKSFGCAQLGVSLDEDNLSRLNLSEQQELSSMSETDYLYTIVCTDYGEQANDVLVKALDWLKEQGRQAIGPLVGRYMASSHKDGLDYYEIWIAVNNC